MQLPAQSDTGVGSPPPLASQEVGGLLATSSSGEGMSTKAPSSSPSSPGSPSRSGGAGTAATTREKPVKVLPCPRCESMNTKFCYYNNYSVTQPRHFCRQCQRYWTAGGTLRNVPVGGGSRKKNRHPRGGSEPYLQRGGGGPVVVTPPTSPFGVGGQQSVLQNVGGHFQQMLSQEMGGGFPQLNFAQLPGFHGYHHHHHPYGSMDPVDLQSPSMQHAMYGTAAPMQSIPPFYQLAQPQQEAPGGAGSFPSNDTAVKSEFWSPHPSMVAPPPPHSGLPNSKRFESSMLLNLGLNSRAPSSQQSQHAQPELGQQELQQQQPDVKPTGGAPTTITTTTKNGSPPHGSSTIEEEGSTPTNGYSNSGYEEADAVSSMWHNLHDMDNIF